MTLGAFAHCSGLPVTPFVILSKICLYVEIGNKGNAKSVFTINLFHDNAITFTRIKVCSKILVAQRIMIKVVYETRI